MDFEFSAEQEALRTSVRRFLADQAPIQPYVREMLDDPRGTSVAVWKGLAELGVTCLLVPEEHGGAGMGMVDMGVVLEELGRAVHPGPVVSTAVAAASALASCSGGGDLLAGIAAGTLVATVPLTEADGRDWRQVATVAHGGVLTGTKTFVPDAAAADALIVTAVEAGQLGLYAIEAGATGLRVVPDPSVDRTRKQATVHLDEVPARRLDQGDTTEVVAEVVDRLLVALAVDGVGAAHAVLDLALAYAKE